MMLALFISDVIVSMTPPEKKRNKATPRKTNNGNGTGCVSTLKRKPTTSTYAKQNRSPENPDIAEPCRSVTGAERTQHEVSQQMLVFPDFGQTQASQCGARLDDDFLLGGRVVHSA